MPNTNGLELIKPTSIVSTGSGNSSSISANGSVSFSSCNTVSLNGVFSSTYENYMIVCREKAVSTAGYSLTIRLRAAGTDNSTASSYTYQRAYINSGTITAVRSSWDQAFLYDTSGSNSGFVGYFYGPFIAQPTSMRFTPAPGYLGTMSDTAVTHNQSVSYDGFTLIIPTTTVAGRVAIYGMRK